MSVAPVGVIEGKRHVTRADVEEALQHRTYLYDRQGDAHYDTSAPSSRACAAPTPMPRSTGSPG